MSEPKYRGVPVFIDGRTLIVPCLSLRQFRDNYAALTEPISTEGQTGAQQNLALYERYVPIIGLALRRNYPEITDDSLYDALDLDTFLAVFQAVQNASGLEKVDPGKA